MSDRVASLRELAAKYGVFIAFFVKRFLAHFNLVLLFRTFVNLQNRFLSLSLQRQFSRYPLYFNGDPYLCLLCTKIGFGLWVVFALAGWCSVLSAAWRMRHADNVASWIRWPWQLSILFALGELISVSLFTSAAAWTFMSPYAFVSTDQSGIDPVMIGKAFFAVIGSVLAVFWIRRVVLDVRRKPHEALQLFLNQREVIWFSVCFVWTY